MVGVLIDQRIFNDLIEDYLPKIAAQFKDLGFDTSLFSIQWFVCVFCKNLSGSLLEIVLDNLVILGSEILFKTGLAILKILEPELLKTKDFRKLYLYNSWFYHRYSGTSKDYRIQIKGNM
jgi:hypothetical protein